MRESAKRREALCAAAGRCPRCCRKRWMTSKYCVVCLERRRQTQRALRGCKPKIEGGPGRPPMGRK
jgi:hypothetical protein